MNMLHGRIRVVACAGTIIIGVFLSVIVLPAAPAGAATYTIESIGPMTYYPLEFGLPISSNESYKYLAVNDAGQVAGTYVGDFGMQAFRWTSGSTLQPLGGWNPGLAQAINNNGQVPAYGDFGPPARWTDGPGWEELYYSPPPNCSQQELCGINDAGTVTGAYVDDSTGGYVRVRSAVWIGVGTGAQRMDLGQIGNGVQSNAFDINNNGLVVGVAEIDDNPVPTGCIDMLPTRAFTVTTTAAGGVGTMTQLPSLTGTLRSQAAGINNDDVIVGSCNTDPDDLYLNTACRWTNSGSGYTVHHMGLLAGYVTSEALEISDNDVAVGYARNPTQSPVQGSAFWADERALVWDPDSATPVDLNTEMHVAGWTLEHTSGVNVHGQIVGYGVNPNNEAVGFLLTPVTQSINVVGTTPIVIPWNDPDSWEDDYVPGPRDPTEIDPDTGQSVTVEIDDDDDVHTQSLSVGGEGEAVLELLTGARLGVGRGEGVRVNSGGRLNINDGAVVELCGALSISGESEPDREGRTRVEGELMASIIKVGEDGKAVFEITGDGLVESDSGRIGDQPGSDGEVIVGGTDAKWAIEKDLDVGKDFADEEDHARGRLIIEADGVVEVGGALRIRGDDTSAGEGRVEVRDGAVLSVDVVDVGEDSVFALLPGSRLRCNRLEGDGLGDEIVGGDFEIGHDEGDTPAIVKVGGEGNPRSFLLEELTVGFNDDAELEILTGGQVESEEVIRLKALGILRLNGGELTAPRFDYTEGGVLELNDGVLNVDEFDGDLVNDGSDIDPGSSPGLMVVTGDMTLNSGSIKMELDGITRATTSSGGPGEYDAINIGGTLTPGGTLDVVLYGTFNPQFDESFDLFDWGDITSDPFDTVNLPGLDAGLSWDIDKLYTDGTITVVPEPATLSLLVLGGLVALRRRRNNQRLTNGRTKK